jgi:hypothetical protein
LTKTLELATQLYFWPGMKNAIKVKVGTCSACIALLPSQHHEPLIMERAKYPMEKVAADLFDLEAVSFLVLVDRYSGYPFVAPLRSTTTEAVCLVLLKWFCEVGFPRRLKSDNGPQFRGPFKEVCDKFSIAHDTSSPYHPQSNGLAESAVKAMKGLLVKVGKDVSGVEFRLALLAWRNTPRADGYSPAYAFFGRHLRTQLPDVRAPLVPTGTAVMPGQTAVGKAREDTGVAAAGKAGGRSLARLQVGDRVHFQKTEAGRWHTGGRVLEVLSERSCVIRTAEGDYRKNRVNLCPALADAGEAPVERGAAVEAPVERRAAAAEPVGRAAALVPAWLGSRVPEGPRRSRRSRHVTFQLPRKEKSEKI